MGGQVAAGERRMLCQGGAKNAPTDKHPSEQKAASKCEQKAAAKREQKAAAKEDHHKRAKSLR